MMVINRDPLRGSSPKGLRLAARLCPDGVPKLVCTLPDVRQKIRQRQRKKVREGSETRCSWEGRLLAVILGMDGGSLGRGSAYYSVLPAP